MKRERHRRKRGYSLSPGIAKRLLAERSRMDGECQVWTGNISHGYPRLNVGGALFLAHRLSKALADGVPYKGLHIHHICRNKACIRPEHLQPITNTDHHREHHPFLLVCGRGHSMADAYPRPDGKGRQCRKCIKLRSDRLTERKRAARAQRPPLSARPCCVCGVAFRPAKFDRARYCGQRCRMAAFKARSFDAAPPKVGRKEAI